MVLLKNSKTTENISLEAFLQNEHELGQVNNQFAQSQALTVCENIKSIYVLQSEFAVIDDRIDSTPIVVGSDEATTCVICIFLGANLCLVAHVDSQSSQELNKMLQKLKDRDQSVIDVYICGAYSDEKNTGEKVVENILQYLNLEKDLQFRIKLACVGDVNTNLDGSPNKTSLAIELPSQRFFAAQFNNKGPEIIRRRAKFWVDGGREGNVYNTEEAQIQVKSYRVNISLTQANYFQWILQLDDRSFLQVTSTSPQHEAPDYSQELREVFRWLLANNGSGADGEIMKFDWEQNQGWIQVQNNVQQQQNTYNSAVVALT